MVFRRFATHLTSAKNIGRNLFHQAQRIGGAIDKGMGIAKRAYGIVAPALREFGVNTGQMDRMADKGFTGYNQLRDRVVQGNEIATRTVGRLAGIT